MAQQKPAPVAGSQKGNTMRKLVIAFATALFAASAPFATFAAGLGVNANANGNTAVNVGSAKSSAMISAHANTAATTQSYGTVVSEIASGKNQSLPSSVTNIEIIPLSSLKGSARAHAKALAQLTKKHASSISKLDNSIAANAKLMAKLTAAGYTADQVVAISTSANGSVTLYVNA